MLLKSLIVTVVLAVTLYLISFLLASVTAIMEKPDNRKASFKVYCRVLKNYWKLLGGSCRWNVFAMIWKELRYVRRTFTKEFREELKAKQVKEEQARALIHLQPTIALTLITSRLQETEAFSNFPYRLLWVVPALFPPMPDDDYQSRCPFELTAEQRTTAVEIYKATLTETSIPISEQIAPLMFAPSFADNQMVWTAYEKLEVGDWKSAKTKRVYQLPDWEVKE